MDYGYTRLRTDHGYLIFSMSTHHSDWNIKANVRRLNQRSQLPLSVTTVHAPEPPSISIDINTLFKTAAPQPPQTEEPAAEQLPSVDRLTQLFSRAMTMH